MRERVSREEEEKSIKKTQRIVAGAGVILFLVGVVRQWPIYGKTYRQFIEGDGYLAFMVGLITIILGLSIRLFTGDFYDDPLPDDKNSAKSEKGR